jgi:diguanylate cyclase (GGDEF)-like protein
MMIDLDHFKRINDTHGHDVGDEVLRRVGQTLRQVMRGTDIFGRMGGEEFAVAMPETGLADAMNVAERLRERFAEVRVPTWSEPVAFTVSIGISHLNSAETLLSQLIKRADEALYEAKRRGRDLVVTDEDIVETPPA